MAYENCGNRRRSHQRSRRPSGLRPSRLRRLNQSRYLGPSRRNPRRRPRRPQLRPVPRRHTAQPNPRHRSSQGPPPVSHRNRLGWRRRILASLRCQHRRHPANTCRHPTRMPRRRPRHHPSAIPASRRRTRRRIQCRPAITHPNPRPIARNPVATATKEYRRIQPSNILTLSLEQP